VCFARMRRRVRRGILGAGRILKSAPVLNKYNISLPALCLLTQTRIDSSDGRYPAAKDWDLVSG
jgi:hypothetical protein